MKVRSFAVSLGICLTGLAALPRPAGGELSPQPTSEMIHQAVAAADAAALPGPGSTCARPTGSGVRR
jgi:hypothetical protein